MRTIAFVWVIIGLVLGGATASPAAEWKQAEGPLKTQWTKDVSPQNAWPEYPRPQMVRKQWQNLNGLWQFANAMLDEQPPFGRELGEQILVPYPVESALSGIMRHEPRTWYRRTFEVAKEWSGKHVLLHFDAVDWEATAYLNGQKLGTHRGGYDAFGFDITGFLKRDGPQELVVGVFDPTDSGDQPRGKQVNRPQGIFYTPTSGIWQTVWIEPVDEKFIEGLRIEPDVDAGVVRISVNAPNARRGQVTVEASHKTEAPGGSGSFSASASGPVGKPVVIQIPNADLWSPDHPALYDLHVKLTFKDQTVDEVDSYFAMRKISLGKDDKGIPRILLNNRFVFEVGPLDQGFWPDGIYTAPTDHALAFDIEAEKILGFNMVRKHVKVEPERWYYWTDKLGLLVWQDMPSANNRTPESREQFIHELDRLIQGRGNHPSIVMWVPFNEEWGEKPMDVPTVVRHIRALDPTRLVDDASGWTDKGVGDVMDMHHYPDPSMPKVETVRAAVLGEFGGLGLAIDGHTWKKEHWGYRGVADREQLTDSYVRMLARAWAMKDKGLNACVYTQITDCETETNGLLTYDRQVMKVDAKRAAAANHGHAPRERVLLPTSQQEPQTWHYATEKPSDDFYKPDFDDAAWKQGPGGFGTNGTPGAVVGTNWNTDDIWLRRHFELPAGDHSKADLELHHDDDVEVYVNGVLAYKQGGYFSDYQSVPIAPEARATLKTGDNVIAIHCHQRTGGQYIDAGINQLQEAR